MNQVVKYLNQNKVVQFSTIKDGEVVMRPFTFIFEKDGQYIFYTDNTKEVFNELKANPTAGFGVMGQDMNWVRVRGKVGFSDSPELKEEVFKAHPLLEKLYVSSSVSMTAWQVYTITQEVLLKKLNSRSLMT